MKNTLQELISTLGLNQSLLAKQIGISPTAFNNKLRGNKISYTSKEGMKILEYHFNPIELGKLLTLLRFYSDTINSYLLLTEQEKNKVNGTSERKQSKHK